MGLWLLHRGKLSIPWKQDEHKNNKKKVYVTYMNDEKWVIIRKVFKSVENTDSKCKE